MRLLVWLALAAIVYLALRSRARALRQQMRNTGFDAELNPRAGMQTKAAAPVENMVACAHCQLYLPASDAVSMPVASSTELLYFCCEDHAKAHASNPSAAPHE